MKKKLFLTATLTLVVILILAMPVLAAPLGSWTTDFTLFNLSNSATANITIKRYTQCSGSCSADAGTTVVATTIAAGGSFYYNPALDGSFPGGFAGSIVVSSDQQLAGTVTLANNLTGTGYASDAYSAVSAPSTSVFLPIVIRQGAWSTRITVQNTGTSNTNVTINYIGGGAPSATTVSNLPPNMMAMVDLSDMGSISFNGSASVSSTGGNAVAVIVEEYKTAGGVLISYNGIPSSLAGATLYMPGYIDQGVWATDFTIVNTGGSTANVTVTFAGSGASLSGPISGNSSVYLNRYGGVPSGWSGSYPTSYYGAATISAPGGTVLAAYNIANSGTGGAGNLQAGYVAFAASQAGTTVVVPLVEDLYSTGWVTTFSVQSTDGTPADLTLLYSAQSGSCNGSCSKSYNMATGESAHTFNQANDGHLNTGFLGGVTITSNKSIVVIADQSNFVAPNYASGDMTAGFVGFKTSP